MSLYKRNTESFRERLEPFLEMLNKFGARDKRVTFTDYDYIGGWRGDLELYQDKFQDEVQLIHIRALLKAAMEVVPWIRDVPVANADDMLELLRDPSLFDIEVTKSQDTAHRPGEVYTETIHHLARDLNVDDFTPAGRQAFFTMEDEVEWKELQRIAAKELDPPIQLSLGNIEHIVERKHRPLSTRILMFDIVVNTRLIWTYNANRLEEALHEYRLETEEEQEPEQDDVIYEFDDGFYVANLSPSELPREGRKQGFCIGRKDMPYLKELRKGNIAVFSLRTPSGKPKLTFTAELVKPDKDGLYEIENYPRIFAGNWVTINGFYEDEGIDSLRLQAEFKRVAEKSGMDVKDVKKLFKRLVDIREKGAESFPVEELVIGIDQIKGKANRLPGFAAGEHGKLKFGPEVEKAVEFVTFLGVHPQDIRDLKPGYEALDDWKAEQEAKRQKQKAKKTARQNPPEIKVAKYITRQADAAYNEPFGGEW